MPSFQMLEAKTQLSRLVEMALRGEEVLILRNGEPVARLVPVAKAAPRPAPGRFEGQVRWTSDAFEPLTDAHVDELFGK